MKLTTHNKSIYINFLPLTIIVLLTTALLSATSAYSNPFDDPDALKVKIGDGRYFLFGGKESRIVPRWESPELFNALVETGKEARGIIDDQGVIIEEIPVGPLAPLYRVDFFNIDDQVVVYGGIRQRVFRLPTGDDRVLNALGHQMASYNLQTSEWNLIDDPRPSAGHLDGPGYIKHTPIKLVGQEIAFCWLRCEAEDRCGSQRSITTRWCIAKNLDTGLDTEFQPYVGTDYTFPLMNVNRSRLPQLREVKIGVPITVSPGEFVRINLSERKKFVVSSDDLEFPRIGFHDAAFPVSIVLTSK